MKEKDERAKPVLCWVTQKPPDEAPCPYGCEVCLEEECDEYFIAYTDKEK